MSSFTHPQGGQSSFIAKGPGSIVVIAGSLAVLLAGLIASTVIAPSILVMPVMSLAATVVASLAGLAAWLGQPSTREKALLIAGIFALAAIAAAIIGDPDQVALLLK